MTFNSGAWAVNGPILDAALARRAQFSATGGNEGITQKPDLKVSQLAVPGSGLLIAAGVGSILNRYQATVNETYVVSNPSSHTVPRARCRGPARRRGRSSSPWWSAIRTSTRPATHGCPPLCRRQVETFEYVRVTLIEVASGATSLNVNYPALALARIDIPAGATSITNAMITDLRKLAQPRQWSDLKMSPADTWTTPYRYVPTVAYDDWGAAEYAPSVVVPSWASRALVICSLNGVVLNDNSVNIVGSIRIKLGSTIGSRSGFDFETQVGGGAELINLQTASEFDVTAVAGTTVPIRLNAYQWGPASPTDTQKLAIRSGSQMIFDIRFFEE